jgi:hypothetical protein
LENELLYTWIVAGAPLIAPAICSGINGGIDVGVF